VNLKEVPTIKRLENMFQISIPQKEMLQGEIVDMRKKAVIKKR